MAPSDGSHARHQDPRRDGERDARCRTELEEGPSSDGSEGGHRTTPCPAFPPLTSAFGTTMGGIPLFTGRHRVIRLDAVCRKAPSPGRDRSRDAGSCAVRWPDHVDRAGLRGRRRADGSRHRAGPRGDRVCRSPCTNRTSRGPRRAATGSRPTSIGRWPRAASARRIATPPWRASSQRPTSRASPTADLVIEAVFEDLAVKSALWRDLDALAPAAAIFASNTSSIAIHRLAEAVDARAPRAVRRDALLQPRAGHAAHRADPRP